MILRPRLVCSCLAIGLLLAAGCNRRGGGAPSPSPGANAPGTGAPGTTPGAGTAAQPSPAPAPLVRAEVVEVREGKGALAAAGKKLVLHYKGFLQATGQEFDNSYDRKQPINFILGMGMVIPGLERGVNGMKVGGIRRLTIPPDLAYGSESNGTIPPNSALIYEVELLDVRNPTKAEVDEILGKTKPAPKGKLAAKGKAAAAPPKAKAKAAKAAP